MKFWRFVGSFCALAAAIGFVAYANSRPTRSGETQVYHSHYGVWGALLGSCDLKVVQHGDTFSFTPLGNSNKEFYSAWPGGPGVLELLTTYERGASYEGPNQFVDETLEITFAGTDGHVEPVSYVYRSSAESAGADGHRPYEISCAGL